MITSICGYLGINCFTIGRGVSPGQIKDGEGDKVGRGELRVEKKVGIADGETNGYQHGDGTKEELKKVK